MSDTTGARKATEDETAKNKAAAAKRESEASAKEDNGSFLNQDRFDNPDAKGLTAYATATDGGGVERIVGPAPTAWSPAPLTATDEQIAAAKKREAAFEEASKTRLSQLKGEIKDEDRAKNVPGDGGSQNTPAL